MDTRQPAGRSRRLVAVALTEHESARAGSPLAAICGSAAETDLLVVRRDHPPGERSAADPVDAEDYPDPDAGPAADRTDEPDARVGHSPGDRIRMHRLGLRRTLRDGDEGDLVAALSELVGFDPDDDTYCVGPTRTGPVADPEIEVVRRAVRRVARVYGLPVLPYRPLVGDGPEPECATAGRPGG